MSHWTYEVNMRKYIHAYAVDPHDIPKGDYRIGEEPNIIKITYQGGAQAVIAEKLAVAQSEYVRDGCNFVYAWFLKRRIAKLEHSLKVLKTQDLIRGEMQKK